MTMTVSSPSPETALSTPDWHHRAACRGLFDDTFFPVGTSGPAVAQKNRAKAMCRSCPVAAACYRWSVEAGEPWGVWGGVDEDERRRRNTVRAFEQLDAPPEPEPLPPNPLDDLSAEARAVALAIGPRDAVPEGTSIAVRSELTRSRLFTEYLGSRKQSKSPGGVRWTNYGRESAAAYREREARAGTRVTEQLGLPLAGAL